MKTVAPFVDLEDGIRRCFAGLKKPAALRSTNDAACSVGGRLGESSPVNCVENASICTRVVRASERSQLHGRHMDQPPKGIVWTAPGPETAADTRSNRYQVSLRVDSPDSAKQLTGDLVSLLTQKGYVVDSIHVFYSKPVLAKYQRPRT